MESRILIRGIHLEKICLRINHVLYVLYKSSFKFENQSRSLCVVLCCVVLCCVVLCCVVLCCVVLCCVVLCCVVLCCVVLCCVVLCCVVLCCVVCMCKNQVNVQSFKALSYYMANVGNILHEHFHKVKAMTKDD